MRSIGHVSGLFTIVHSGLAITVRIYQADLHEYCDGAGPITGTWAWSEQDDETDDYHDTDDEVVIDFPDVTDLDVALGRMAVIAVKEMIDALAPDGPEY